MVFNLITNKTDFPPKWKKSVIVSIFKESHRQNASNYGPISLLSAVSKVLARLIFDKINVACHLLEAFPESAYFRRKRPSVSNLIEFFHLLYTQLDWPNYSNITAFYIDFREAFDKVSHQRILEKLSKLAIGSNCFNLIKSHLEHGDKPSRSLIKYQAN